MAILSSFAKKNKSLFPLPRGIRLAGIVVCMVLAVLGCRSREADNGSNLVRVRLKKNPATLDPARIVDLDGARIAAKLYRGLVRFDEQLQPVPDLAESWRIAENGRTYVFTLRRGVLFHDGHELTADDVVFSFERVLTPATRSPRTWVLAGIAGARQFMDGTASSIAGLRTQGRYEVVIELTEPSAPFLFFLGLTTAHIVSLQHHQTAGSDEVHSCLVGTGPFRLARWQHNQYVVLERHEAYYRGMPLLKGIRYEIIPEDFTALVAFEKGDIDLLPEVTVADYDRLARDPLHRFSMVQQAALNTYYLGLNCQQKPFTDVRVRRALHYALDKQKILEKVLCNQGTQAHGPVPPLLCGTAGAERYPYDPVKARALLHEAGYPHGFPLTIYQAADGETLDILQAVQSYFNAVGIATHIRQLEWSTFLDMVGRGDAQAFWLSWWADYPDAENFLFPLFHSKNWGPGGNRCRFRDPAVDTALREAVATGDILQRQAAYRTIEDQIIDASPMVWCWHKSVTGVCQPWVQGLTLPALPAMETWENVWILPYKKEEPPGRG